MIITLERFARITFNLRFAILTDPKRDSQKKAQFGNPHAISRESGDSRESANRFARFGPSKMSDLRSLGASFYIQNWGGPRAPPDRFVDEHHQFPQHEHALTVVLDLPFSFPGIYSIKRFFVWVRMIYF